MEFWTIVLFIFVVRYYIVKMNWFYGSAFCLLLYFSTIFFTLSAVRAWDKYFLKLIIMSKKKTKRKMCSHLSTMMLSSCILIFIWYLVKLWGFPKSPNKQWKLKIYFLMVPHYNSYPSRQLTSDASGYLLTQFIKFVRNIEIWRLWRQYRKINGILWDNSEYPLKDNGRITE